MSELLTRRVAVTSGLALTVLPNVARADTPIISAPEALQAVADGRMVLLDIRTPKEWRETGIAKGAWPVSMHTSDFQQKFQSVLAKHKPEEIAIICATGGRTARLTKLFIRHGVTGITDVSEGMIGNRLGPGWIKRGLPVVTPEQAQADFDAALAETPSGISD